MKLQTVIDNINNTIEEKVELWEKMDDSNVGKIMKQFLEININDLTKIRDDLNKIKE